MTVVKVLDHGYVKIVETWGSDEKIIEAARQSVRGGFVSWDPYDGHPKGDAGLLRFMWEHQHATPFEFAGMIIEVQAPIFVFREWHRHRTQSYSEASARYAPLPDLNYVPTVERLMMSSASNKQAGTIKGAAALTEEDAVRWQNNIVQAYADAEFTYAQALIQGVPKELARIVLPVGRYSRMCASANLRNWLAFLKLRLDENAQQEIRDYAKSVDLLVASFFPRTHALFRESIA